ncbi:MAG: hypothetical protein ACREB3_15870 [Burkholderiales bacterium]
MSARYLQLDALQEPYDLGVDELGRTKIQFNLAAQKTASVGSVFEQELAKILTTAAPGTFSSSGGSRNIFIGTTAKIPSGPGPYLSIISTSGAPPQKIHNNPGPSYFRPTALIVARATDQTAAIAMARAAYDALTVVVNQTVTP